MDEVIADFQKGQAMKTLFIALRAGIFGTGFIFLWGWVALSLHHRYDVTFGFALYEQSVAILLFTLPWLLSAHLFVILYEEPHLRSTFGAQYDVYCRSVRRWLPRRLPMPKLRISLTA